MCVDEDCVITSEDQSYRDWRAVDIIQTVKLDGLLGEEHYRRRIVGHWA